MRMENSSMWTGAGWIDLGRTWKIVECPRGGEPLAEQAVGASSVVGNETDDKLKRA